jgi:hypothetical protein
MVKTSEFDSENPGSSPGAAAKATRFQIIQAKPFHCGQMVRVLRREHKAAWAEFGVDPHRELRERFAASYMCRAWLIDGKLAALGGVVGTALAPVGYVWLTLSELALQHRIAAAREARRQLAEIMIVKRELAILILPQDKSAMRLAIFLGFHVADQGLGSRAETKPQRRALRLFLESAEELRVPRGNSRAIPMGYHVEAA